jgi:hypothetical protein
MSGTTEPENRQALLTALTTEHFGLAGARSAAVGEIAGRSSLYLSSVASVLIALGFIGQASHLGDAFRLFAVAVMPVLFFLGAVTYFRVLEKSIEDLYLARAVNRIRQYYLQLAGDEARFFMLSGHDDAAGVFANMAVWSPGLQSFLTSAASMIGVVNSVVGGAAVALLLGTGVGLSLAIAGACGIAVTLALIVLHVAFERRAFRHAFARAEPMFPTPPDV